MMTYMCVQNAADVGSKSYQQVLVCRTIRAITLCRESSDLSEINLLSATTHAVLGMMSAHRGTLLLV
jgi:hypothetical protein